MHEAMLYEKLDGNSVKCNLCRHRCTIKDNSRGLCNVRENRSGALYSIFYAKPITMSVDPIEKKPLFHFYPSTTSFSIATLGCNFQCEFCQNWDISQFGRGAELRDTKINASPEKVVESAVEHKCKSISYTYSEPTIFFEYAYDIGVLAHKNDIKNVFVTNAYMTPETIETASDFLDAANVDLKAFKDKTYKQIMKADLNGVLDSIKLMHQRGIWLEVTTLIVPGMNDDPSEIKDIAEFIASIDKGIPWHISRFYPNYKFAEKTPTPIETLESAYQIGKDAGLKYVYLGNVSGHDTESTYCYNCNTKIIERIGYQVNNNLITDNRCPKCNSKIDGCF
ncbi:AmmeMemoRadiSam system radical SAM enzyme [bacterium]|nr:AmmeMemoRadiSam system radical SAM enzyme [bacterium]